MKRYDDKQTDGMPIRGDCVAVTDLASRARSNLYSTNNILGALMVMSTIALILIFHGAKFRCNAARVNPKSKMRPWNGQH